MSSRASEPLTANNPRLRDRIRYRADDYAGIRAALVQRLQEQFPEWNPSLLEKGGDQDLAVALIELFSHMGDILGFYQDIRANEAFLRTATLPASVVDLCRLIGYRARPGAAASTLQVFLLKPGTSGLVPAGFRAQSEATERTRSLIFETAHPLEAHADRNVLRIFDFDRSEVELVLPGTTSVQLSETHDGLSASSFVVLEGLAPAAVALRLTSVLLEEVEEKHTLYWDVSTAPSASGTLADLTIHGAPEHAMALASRSTADALPFGTTTFPVEDPTIFSAGFPVLIVSGPLEFGARYLSSSGSEVLLNRGANVGLRRSETKLVPAEQEVGTLAGILRPGAMTIRLDTKIHEVFAGDRLLIVDALGVEVATVAGSGTGPNEIYLVEGLPRWFRGDPTIRLFRLSRDWSSASWTSVSPSVIPASERRFELDRTYDGLEPGTWVVLADGHAPAAARRVGRVEVNADARTVLELSSGETAGHPYRTLDLTLYGAFRETMRVDGFDRSRATVDAGATELELSAVVEGLEPGARLVIDDGSNAEGLRVTGIVQQSDRTRISLERPLENSYARADAQIFGNVALVTHGETTRELLGSGDRDQAGQRFTLKRSPTTYFADPSTPRGVRSTLQVLVDGERWTEVDSLATSGPEDRHVVVEIDEEQRSTVCFGDGIHGARPTTGRDNIRAIYRVGLGGEGNVATGAVRLMPDPRDFIEKTFNGIVGTGGADPDGVETIRRSAPSTVRTLDRAVSLEDYADIALSHAGVKKARAHWEWAGGRRLVVVTVAAAEGMPLTSTLKTSLFGHLDARRARKQRLDIRDFEPVAIDLTIDVAVRANFLQTETRVHVIDALRAYFDFEARTLGGDASLSDIYRIVEGVRGVDHATARAFHRAGAALTVKDRIVVGDSGLATLGALSIAASGGIR